MEKHCLVTGHELKLVGQPKPITKQNEDSEKQSVGHHFIPLDVSRNLDVVFP